MVKKSKSITPKERRGFVITSSFLNRLCESCYFYKKCQISCPALEALILKWGEEFDL